jgi:hypothetical protein
VILCTGKQTIRGDRLANIHHDDCIMAQRYYIIIIPVRSNLLDTLYTLSVLRAIKPYAASGNTIARVCVFLRLRRSVVRQVLGPINILTNSYASAYRIRLAFILLLQCFGFVATVFPELLEYVNVDRLSGLFARKSDIITMRYGFHIGARPGLSATRIRYSDRGMSFEIHIDGPA